MAQSHDNLAFAASTDAISGGKWEASNQENRNSYSRNGRNSVYIMEMEEKKKKSIQEDEEEYDPHLHRVVTHPTTNTETLLHLLKGSLGTGILAMPNAFHNAGYAVGLVATIIIGLLCTYCIRILVDSQYELCKRKRIPALSYPATAEAALSEGPRWLRPLAKPSIHIVNAFLLIYQLGTCCVYVMFIASNLQMGLDSFLPKVDVRIVMAILLVPLVFVNWIRNLKFLAPCSTVANCVTFVSFGIILYYIFREPLTFEGRPAVGDVANFPLFFGTVLFALEAIGVIMPLENEMKTPKTFLKPAGILNLGMGLIILLYAGLGFFGYICYGSAIKGSITFNLSDTEVLAKVVQVLLALAIYFTHPVQCYVAIDILWNDYAAPRLEKNPHKLFWEFFVRTCIVLFTTLLAIAIPELELFISLFGALCLSALGLAFPALIQLCTLWNVSKGMGKLFLFSKNVALIAFGFLGLVVGTYTSLRDIIATFS